MQPSDKVFTAALAFVHAVKRREAETARDNEGLPDYRDLIYNDAEDPDACPVCKTTSISGHEPGCEWVALREAYDEYQEWLASFIAREA